MIEVTITAKPSGLIAYEIWLSEAQPGAEGIAVPMEGHEARVNLEPGNYFIYWGLFGSPGGSLASEVKTPNGEVVVSIKEPKIKAGTHEYAIVKRFTV